MEPITIGIALEIISVSLCIVGFAYSKLKMNSMSKLRLTFAKRD